MVFGANQHVAGPRRQLWYALLLRQRLLSKRVVSFIEERLQQRMFRMMGLQDHLALFAGTACAARYLGYKAGSGSVPPSGNRRRTAHRPTSSRETGVTSGEVVTLRQHLCTDKNARAAAINNRQDIAQARLCGWWYLCRYGEIGISGNSGPSACSSCSVPKPTGTRCVEPQEGTGAGSALAVAVVAAQMMLSLMQRVVAVAARALCYPAAVV